jgi:hypothetical protein
MDDYSKFARALERTDETRCMVELCSHLNASGLYHYHPEYAFRYCRVLLRLPQFRKHIQSPTRWVEDLSGEPVWSSDDKQRLTWIYDNKKGVARGAGRFYLKPLRPRLEPALREPVYPRVEQKPLGHDINVPLRAAKPRVRVPPAKREAVVPPGRIVPFPRR